MAGKFVNTEQKVTFDTLSENVKELMKNPYYQFSDKKGSVCQYYNINDKKTTLDEATRANYSELGPNSPIRYNKIKDAIIYGITKMDIALDITDFGLELKPGAKTLTEVLVIFCFDLSFILLEYTLKAFSISPSIRSASLSYCTTELLTSSSSSSSSSLIKS